MDSKEIEAIRAAMRSTTLSGQGNYLPTGRHVLKIESWTFKKPGQKIPMGLFLCEFKAVSSSNSETELESKTYSEGFDPAKSGWDGRMIKFLLAALGLDWRAPAPSDAQDLVADIRLSTQDGFGLLSRISDEEKAKLIAKYGQEPAKFLVGRIVVAEGSNYRTKNQKDIVSLAWSPAVSS